MEAVENELPWSGALKLKPPVSSGQSCYNVRTVTTTLLLLLLSSLLVVLQALPAAPDRSECVTHGCNFTLFGQSGNVYARENCAGAFLETTRHW